MPVPAALTSGVEKLHVYEDMFFALMRREGRVAVWNGSATRASRFLSRAELAVGVIAAHESVQVVEKLDRFDAFLARESHLEKGKGALANRLRRCKVVDCLHLLAHEDALGSDGACRSYGAIYAALQQDGTLLACGDHAPSDVGGLKEGLALGALSEADIFWSGERSGVKKMVGNSRAVALLLEGGAVAAFGDKACGGDVGAVADELSQGVIDVVSAPGSRAFAALKAGGEVVTWGDPSCGGDSTAVASQLREGVVRLVAHASPQEPGALPRGAFCAIKANGHVVCWGDPQVGGDAAAVADQLAEGVDDVVGNGWSFAAWKKSSGTIVCWPVSGDKDRWLSDELGRDIVALSSTSCGEFGAAFAALRVL
eukprot:TRINITY_DN34400_c0_g1_i3.p1 TRINITY_DN34400_c0_g1~~TRINITY_DN34400_c0_g1_i3.p1  ORF type:complete len:369 (+),score=83.17 TRINITY_DN34400_c0_g1_i3:348-1454(+)